MSVAAMLLGAAVLPLSMAFAQSGPAPASAKPFLTVDGKAPLVLGHRGLPGLVPEETEASYDLAAALGTDALEEDLHLTKDCVLVVRHNPWLSDNTNIATVALTNDTAGAGTTGTNSDHLTSDASLTVSGEESGAATTYSVDGGAFSASYDPTSLLDGDHTVVVRATDQADEAGRACGACDSCRLRREGFAAAGVADPTNYSAAKIV